LIVVFILFLLFFLSIIKLILSLYGNSTLSVTCNLFPLSYSSSSLSLILYVESLFINVFVILSVSGMSLSLLFCIDLNV
jgi:hypothetical protein